MTLPPDGIERRRPSSSPASIAIANSDRLAHLIRITWIALAIYVALAVTVASVIGVINSISAVDHATKAEKFANQALQQARLNTGIGQNVERLVAAQGPCEPGDPRDSPGCLRDARVQAAVNEIKDAIARDMNTHDLNNKVVHERLVSLHNRRNRTTRHTHTSITTRSTTTRASPMTTTTIQRRSVLPPILPTTTTKPGRRLGRQ